MLLNTPALSFTSYLDKMPPAEYELEAFLLGAILSSADDMFSIVSKRLPVEAFALETHQKIYRAMHALYKEGRKIDLLTITNYFKERNKLASIGGRNQLALLIDASLKFFDEVECIKTILDKYIRRCAISWGNEVIERCFDDHRDTAEVLELIKTKTELLVNNGLGKSPDEKLSMEYTRLKDRIAEIEMNTSDPAFKYFKIIKLAHETGKSTKQLEQIYLKSLADFADKNLKTVNELRDECGDDDREWLLHGFLPKATTVLLHAEGGVGKTKLAYELAYNLLKGTNWSGYPTTGKRKVMVYQTDESPHDMRHALDARGFDDEMEFRYRDKWVIEAIPLMVKDIKEFNPDFIVIDSLTSVSRYSVFSENDTEYARPMLELVQIAKEYGCTIMVLHHSNGGGGSRGTRAIFNSVSEVWNMKPDPAEGASNLERLLKIEKSRSRAPMTYRLRFDPDRYSWHCLGQEGGDNTDVNQREKILKFLCDNRNTPYQSEEVTVSVGLPSGSVRRILNRLKSEGTISRKGMGTKHKPYCYYIKVNADHTQELEDQKQNSITTVDTAVVDHTPPTADHPHDQNHTSSGVGISENGDHRSVKQGGGVFQNDSQNLQTHDHKTAKFSQGIGNNSDHGGKQLSDHSVQNSDHLPLKEEKVKNDLNLEENSDRNANCERDAISSVTTAPIIVEHLGKLGMTKAEFQVKHSTRKRLKSECKVCFTFPDASEIEVKSYFKLENLDSLKKYVSLKAENWETAFMLNPESKWDVEVMVGSDDEPRMEWVNGCTMTKVATPPISCWYTFVSPTGEELRVAGEDAFKLSEK